MQIFFGILMLVAYCAAAFYLFVRIRQALPAAQGLQVAYTVVFVFVAFSLFVYMFFRNSLPSALLKVMYAVGSTWLIALIYLTAYFLVTDLVWAGNRFFHFLPERISIFSIRQVQVITGFIILSTVLISGYYKFNNPKIMKKEIFINKHFERQNALRIVAVSDLHLGHGIGKARLRRYVEMINRQNADIVLIAGDLVDSSPRPLNEQKMYEELNQIHAPSGVFMCMGNHEYISGAEKSLDFIQKTAIIPLLDSVAHIGNLQIIGRKDLAAHKRLELSELTKDILSENIKILLDHQPYNLQQTVAEGIDLQISGHTHNGQFFPINLIVKGLFELPHGYTQKDDTHFVVSSGLGLWGPPYRIGTQSEIWVLDLKFN